MFIDYKIIRLLYSQIKIFKNSNSIITKNCTFCFENLFNAKFSNLENINKPFKQMLIADILLIDSLIFLICLFVFFNFYFSPEILKLSISVFAIYLILFIAKIGELIVFIPEDEFYNQRKISAVDVKPYINNDKNSDNFTSESEKKKINRNQLNNFAKKEIKNDDENKNVNLKNKFLSEEYNFNNYQVEKTENNIRFCSSKIASNKKHKNKKLNNKRNIKVHNSVCFNNENVIGFNLNLAENYQNKLNSNSNNLQNLNNFNNNFGDENFFNYRLNNSGGIYEMEKYANCDLSKEFNLNANKNTNENKVENLLKYSARKELDCKNSSSNGNYFNYSDFDRKCKSMFTKKNCAGGNNFNLNLESGNTENKYEDFNYNVTNYEENYNHDVENEFSQQQINFKNFNKNMEVNNFANSQLSKNNNRINNAYKNENSSKFKDIYTEAPRRQTFSRFSIHNNSQNPQADKNSEENKDEYSSYKQSKCEINVKKANQNFNNLNSNSVQNEQSKQNKIGFFKKITSSIKKIFPSTKKTQKQQYCVVQDENQVSCFNNRKINTLKAGGIGLGNRLADISIEYKETNKENTINNKIEGGIESTPNFNTNPIVNFNYYGNEVERTSSNVWGFNDIREQRDDYSVSHRTNTGDLSDVDLLRKKN
jgi:hypothetical protein